MNTKRNLTTARTIALALGGIGLVGAVHCSGTPGGDFGANEPVAQTGGLTLLAPTAATASGSEYGVWGAYSGHRDWTSGASQVGDGSQWVSFDMGDQYPFDTITLDCSGTPSDYPGSVDLYVSNDGVNWGSKIKTVTGAAPTTTINGFGTLTYEFIKLVQSGSQNTSHFWTIDQLNVSNAGTAYNPTVTYTTTYQPSGTNEYAWLGTSSSEGTYGPSKAIDGDPGTRWSSDFDDLAWFQVDLGATKSFDTVKIYWEKAGALAFAIQTSTDNQNWTTVVESADSPPTVSDDPTTTNTCPSGYDPNNCALQTLAVSGSSGRYVRFQGLQRKTQYGYSFYAFEVWSGASQLALTAETTVQVSSAETTLSSKRGSAFHLCGWSGVSAGQNDIDALKGSTAWTYNWGDHPGSCVASSPDLSGTTPNLEFVPMVWGITNQCHVANALCASNSDCCSGTCTSNVCTGTAGGNGSATYITDGVDGGSQNTNLSVSTIKGNVPSNAKYVLGFNEPDFSHQSGLTPKQAAGHWGDYEYLAANAGNKAMKIVGPAVNFCDSTCTTDNAGCCTVINDAAVTGEHASSGVREQAFRWLEHFYDECRATYVIDGVTYKGRAGHNCQIDYQAAHSYSWYGIWSINPLKIHAGINSPTATHCSNGVKDGDEDGKDCGGEDCVACDPGVKAIFAKQVWLTEFAPTTDDCGFSGCINSQITNAQKYIGNWVDYNGAPGTGNIPLEKDSFVFRYAWFMPKVNSITSLNNCSLLNATDTTHDPTQVVSVGTSYFNAAYSSGSCTKATCASLGDNCGSPSDGCGGTLSCGTCTSPQTCGGGGTSYHCGGGLTAYSQSGWTATASAGNSSAGSAIDGNLTTRYTSGTAMSNGQTWTLDMKTSQAFSQININVQNSSSDYARSYTVSVSTDNTNWTQVASGSNGSSNLTVSFSSVTDRYIKITNTTTGVTHWWSIDEVNVYH